MLSSKHSLLPVSCLVYLQLSFALQQKQFGNEFYTERFQVKSEGGSLGVDCALCLGCSTVFFLKIGFGAVLVHSSAMHSVFCTMQCVWNTVGVESSEAEPFLISVPGVLAGKHTG